MVRRRRSWLTAAHTCSTFEGVVAVLGRPDRSSLAVEVLPFLKRPNHSKVQLWLMHESPKACFNISKVSLPVLPNLAQNLMHALCSSTSAIPPKSENRRRLMQYTYKDTCNNQTLPQPTTPLGTLTHKTQPQHSLAGNSWNTSGLRVMSIVLGLLDTPSYFTCSAEGATNDVLTSMLFNIIPYIVQLPCVEKHVRCSRHISFQTVPPSVQCSII